MHKKATLILENGKCFAGYALGGLFFQPPSPTDFRPSVSEVVFNTSMTGYQEILTDPSYYRQIVVMTAAEIGTTGINSEDNESPHIYAAGLIVRDYPLIHSSWRATQSLHHFLKKHRVPALYGVDTRELVKEIREKGSLRGMILPDEPSPDIIDRTLATLRSASPTEGNNLAIQVGTQHAYLYRDAEPPQTPPVIDRIVVIDFGCKQTILKHLATIAAEVTVVPPTATAADVLGYRPRAVLFSNGPGDPAAVTSGIALARALIGRLPIFGICLGHQILGLALHVPTFKLKFGHHGANHPVLDVATNTIAITSQNHNFAVDLEAARRHPDIEITHVNLTDHTLEGFRLRSAPLLAIQFHPEAAPGPHDSHSLFSRFAEDILKTTARPANA